MERKRLKKTGKRIESILIAPATLPPTVAHEAGCLSRREKRACTSTPSTVTGRHPTPVKTQKQNASRESEVCVRKRTINGLAMEPLPA